MKRKQPEQELEIAMVNLELARTKAQQITLEKGIKLEIAKLNLELAQKKAQQTTTTASTKEQEDQEAPKLLESTSKEALQPQKVKRARKVVPLLNGTTESNSQKNKSGLPTGATKRSPKPRCLLDFYQKKPTPKPAAKAQKRNQGSGKKKAILDQLQDQAHILTNQPEEAAEVPDQMCAKIGKRMEAFVDDLKDILTKRDEIYLEKINKLEILQDTNAKSLKILTDKVFDHTSKSNLDVFKDTVSESLQRSDTVMAMLHEERERAANKHEDLSREVTTTQMQLGEVVQTIKDLYKNIYQLQKNAVQQSPTPPPPPPPPPPAPVAQVIHHLFRQPGSSSGATFTSRRAPTINDLWCDKWNLQGVHIEEEEHSDPLFLGPP